MLIWVEVRRRNPKRYCRGKNAQEPLCSTIIYYNPCGSVQFLPPSPLGTNWPKALHWLSELRGRLESGQSCPSQSEWNKKSPGQVRQQKYVSKQTDSESIWVKKIEELHDLEAWFMVWRQFLLKVDDNRPSKHRGSLVGKSHSGALKIFNFSSQKLKVEMSKASKRKLWLSIGKRYCKWCWNKRIQWDYLKLSQSSTTVFLCSGQQMGACDHAFLSTCIELGSARFPQRRVQVLDLDSVCFWVPCVFSFKLNIFCLLFVCLFSKSPFPFHLLRFLAPLPIWGS